MSQPSSNVLSLVLLSDPPSEFYKDDPGEQNKAMYVSVSLHKGGVPISQELNFDLCLYYNDGQKVQDQGILLLKAIRRERAAYVIGFRINDVSKNHQKRLFMVGIAVRGRPDIVPVYTAPVKVLSKKSKRRQTGHDDDHVGPVLGSQEARAAAVNRAAMAPLAATLPPQSTLPPSAPPYRHSVPHEELHDRQQHQQVHHEQHPQHQHQHQHQQQQRQQQHRDQRHDQHSPFPDVAPSATQLSLPTSSTTSFVNNLLQGWTAHHRGMVAAATPTAGQSIYAGMESATPVDTTLNTSSVVPSIGSGYSAPTTAADPYLSRSHHGVSDSSPPLDASTSPVGLRPAMLAIQSSQLAFVSDIHDISSASNSTSSSTTLRHSNRASFQSLPSSIPPSSSSSRHSNALRSTPNSPQSSPQVLELLTTQLTRPSINPFTMHPSSTADTSSMHHIPPVFDTAYPSSMLHSHGSAPQSSPSINSAQNDAKTPHPNQMSTFPVTGETSFSLVSSLASPTSSSTSSTSLSSTASSDFSSSSSSVPSSCTTATTTTTATTISSTSSSSSSTSSSVSSSSSTSSLSSSSISHTAFLPPDFASPLPLAGLGSPPLLQTAPSNPSLVTVTPFHHHPNHDSYFLLPTTASSAHNGYATSVMDGMARTSVKGGKRDGQRKRAREMEPVTTTLTSTSTENVGTSIPDPITTSADLGQDTDANTQEPPSKRHAMDQTYVPSSSRLDPPQISSSSKSTSGTQHKGLSKGNQMIIAGLSDVAKVKLEKLASPTSMQSGSQSSSPTKTTPNEGTARHEGPVSSIQSTSSNMDPTSATIRDLLCSGGECDLVLRSPADPPPHGDEGAFLSTLSWLTDYVACLHLLFMDLESVVVGYETQNGEPNLNMCVFCSALSSSGSRIHLPRCKVHTISKSTPNVLEVMNSLKLSAAELVARINPSAVEEMMNQMNTRNVSHAETESGDDDDGDDDDDDDDDDDGNNNNNDDDDDKGGEGEGEGGGGGGGGGGRDTSGHKEANNASGQANVTMAEPSSHCKASEVGKDVTS